MFANRAALLATLMLSLPAASAASAQSGSPSAAALTARPPWMETRHDSLPEPILVELRIGRAASGTIRAYRSGEELLLPVGALLALAEVQYEITQAGLLSAAWPHRRAMLVVDPESRTVRTGERRTLLPADAMLVADGEPYVASATLGALLGVRLSIDWQELVVTLDDPSRFPIALRLEREAARRIFAERNALPHGSGTPDMSLLSSRSSGSGIVLDYSLTSPSESPVYGGGYAIALGADLLGGSLEGAVSSVGRAGDGRVRGELSWTGVWSDAAVVKQLRLGSGISTGPNPRAIRGISLGNSPYLRATDYGEIGYVGDVGPGWMVEAYRGGELIALDSADLTGRFGIRLPVQYGENPVSFVAYGPHGELQEISRLYNVPTDLLPGKRFEYGAALGVCASQLCRATGNVDLRYGVSSRWTMRGGLEQLWRDTLPALSHPYASITGALTNAWSVHLLGIAGTQARAMVRFEPSLDLRVSAEYTRHAHTDRPSPLSLAGSRERWAAMATVRPLGFARSLLAEGWGERIETATGSLSRGRLGISVQRGEVRLSPYVRIEREEPHGLSADTRPFAGVSASVLPLARLGSVLGRVWWRGAIEASSPSHLSSVSVAAASALMRGLRAELGTSWHRAARGAGVTLALAAERGWGRSYTTVTSHGGAAPAMLQSLHGSVLVDRESRTFAFVPGPAVQRAGVEGRVFLDLNGNGRRDPDEPPLSRVRVRVGAQTVESDTSGILRLWDITPFEPVLITVDTMTLASPLWVPLFASVSVIPAPNRFQVVEIPVAPGGVIEGRVLSEAGGVRRGAGGVRVLLRNRHTGVTRGITTFSDGEFAAIAVAPGSYEIRVDGADAARANGAASIVRVDVPPDANGARVAGIELIVPER